MADILLIDDDENIHQIIPLFLKAAGHSVHSALTAEAGLDHLSRHRPDLILLDMAMPVTDGGQFLEALQALHGTQDIPVLVLTVHDLKDLKPFLEGRRCVEYLRKPVSRKTLEESVNTILAGV